MKKGGKMNLREDSNRGILFFVEVLKEFLFERGCDVVCLQLNTFFTRNECIGTGSRFVYFIDGEKKSVPFSEVYKSNAMKIIEDRLPKINYFMSSVSDVLWDFIVIKIYRDGRIFLSFFYDVPQGEYMRYQFSI